MGISHEEASLTLSSGDTVIWTWGEEGMPHDVSSIDPDAPEDFGSEVMTGEGQTYQYTFTDPAEIDYRCSVHPANMTGTLSILPVMSVEERFIMNLKYYPSVVENELNVFSLIPVKAYEIFDINGKIVAKGEFKQGNFYIINTSLLTNGVYFVHVVSENNVKTSFKILKE